MIHELQKRKELPTLLPQNGIGCEIGVMRGMHAKSLFRSKPKEFHLIDFWKHHPKSETWNKYKKEVETVFHGELENGEVVIHEDYAKNVLPTFQDHYFDWMYIDANHQYEHVKHDIELSLRKIKKGGILAGHDFHVAEFEYGSGVIRAVIEKIQEGRLKMIAITNEEKADWVCEVL